MGGGRAAATWALFPREPRGDGMTSRPVGARRADGGGAGRLLAFATAEVVSLADLANEQFILLERGS